MCLRSFYLVKYRNFPFNTINKLKCGEGDLNPRIPAEMDPKSIAFGLARQSPPDS